MAIFMKYLNPNSYHQRALLTSQSRNKVKVKLAQNQKQFKKIKYLTGIKAFISDKTNKARTAPPPRQKKN